ncbi:MAG: hypothetical protein ABSG97_07220 [Sedimentisphaerales bacterium]|jgi:hypothetical protein
MFKKYCISIFILPLVIVSAANALTAGQVLDKYKESLNWAQSVSMQIDVNTEILEWPDANIPDFHPRSQFMYRRDGNNYAWIGKVLVFDVNWKLLDDSSLNIQDIFANGRYFTISPTQRGPNKIPRYAMITRDSNPYYQQRLEELRGDETRGGPLFGRISVNNRYSIADLLCSDTNMSIRPDMEPIRGSLCYVLEGVTKYGHITAWIAPDKAYNALKWSVGKGPNDLVYDKPAGASVERGIYEFDLFDFQEVNGVMVPKNASYTTTVKISGAGKNIGRYTYQVSHVSLNPDFKALGAFTPNVPEGTRVKLLEAPGVRYVWRNGRAVIDVNEATFEKIDKTINQFKQQQDANQ